MEITYKSIAANEVPRVVRFLAVYDMIHEDNPELHIGRLIELNPGLSYLAEADGEVIGTALCSFNGLRGYISRLAVKEEFRKRGIATELINKCEDALREVGCIKTSLNCDLKLVGFYEKRGYENKKSVYLSKKL